MTEQGLWWIITAVIMLVAFIIFGKCTDSFIGLDDLFDFDALIETFCEGGWLVLLSVAGISGIIFGFVYWSWVGMVIIFAGLLLTIGIIIYFVVRSKNKENVDQDYEEEEIKTKYKCVGCGANVFKTVGYEVKYYCPYCNVNYTKKELVDNIVDKNIKAYDLDDFEEEYFFACYYLELKPQCLHTEKQIDRKYDRLIDAVDDYEQEEHIEIAYDFFANNMSEIEEYMKKYTAEEIASRYEYYLALAEDDEEEFDEE